MIHTHLFRIEAGEPGIFRDLVIDESYSLLTGYLDGRFTLLSIIKPCLRPTAVALCVEIDGGNAVYIVTLKVHLQRCQRVYYQSVGCCLLTNFFFTSSPHDDRYTWWRKAI